MSDSTPIGDSPNPLANPKRLRLPVGGRTPRPRSTVDERDPTGRDRGTSAPLFPMGRRFPRNGAAEVEQYLVPAARIVPGSPGAARTAFPVLAPRRAPTTGDGAASTGGQAG
jgi:hypothetical protein